MSKMGHNIEGVAIDLDGTLVNSAPDLAAAANRLLRKLSRPNLTQEHVQALIGDGIDALFDRVLASGSGTYRSLDERTVLRGEFKRSYRERIFARGGLYAGVTDGLTALRRLRLPIAVVTNKPSEFTRPLLSAAGLESWFDPILCADDAALRKPAPAMLETLGREWGIPPHKLLLVGDSTTDIATARAAGCVVAAVDYGYEPRHALVAAGADWIIGSLTEVAAIVTRSRETAAMVGGVSC
tara:strand:+ start:276 stop:995 length:720 start_codon:yes stop_codon:yes gene_type:complete